jgi:phosphatidylinositol alpha-mannosyltransferase
MRIGLVCPYSLDVPGGAQNHVLDLAEALVARGEHVSVLAPADDERRLAEYPDYVVPAGRAVAVPYNGSVARLTFGPVTAGRVRRWLAAGGFDVVHVHEPSVPSLSLLTLWAWDGPMVGTFHTSNARSRVMTAAAAILLPALEKLSARIAVSEDARATLVQHLGGEPVIIPNGVFVSRFAAAEPDPAWSGRGPTVAFLGRMDEPRKGLQVLLAALPAIVEQHPDVNVLIAGKGEQAPARAAVPASAAGNVTFLGMIDDPARARLLAGADVYVAPNTGGESFGIILIEAMAAGAAVLASDIGAFRRVLGDGAFGRLFATGDSAALAAGANELLADAGLRTKLAAAGRRAADRYDRSVVVDQIYDVYSLVTRQQGAPA